MAWRALVAAAVCGVVAGCSANTGPNPGRLFSRIIPEQAPPAAGGPVEEVDYAANPGNDAGLTALAARRDSNDPYEIKGQVYHPEKNPEYDRVGMASWYGQQFHGRRTANGEVFDRMALTAAHPTLPLPSYVRVTNLENDRSIMVRVNDRGPFSHSRLIDVSEQTAEMLAFRHDGSTRVRVQFVAAAPRSANDGAMLAASYRGPDVPAVAFAEEDQPPRRRKVVAALGRLTGGGFSATDRILMAFDVADAPPR